MPTDKLTVKLTEDQIWAIIEMLGPVKDLDRDDPIRAAWMALVSQVTGNA